MARDCNSVNAGSIPTRASIFSDNLLFAQYELIKANICSAGIGLAYRNP